MDEPNGKGQDLRQMEAQATLIGKGALPPGSVDLSPLVKLIRIVVPQMKEPPEAARQFATGLVGKLGPKLAELEWQTRPLLIVQWIAEELLLLKKIADEEYTSAATPTGTTSSPTPEASLPAATKPSSDETSKPSASSSS